MSALPLVTRARGVHLYDDQGRQWLDGCSGAVNVNLGHGVPEVLDRMRAQAEQVCFAYRTQFTSSSVRELREGLALVAPAGLRHAEFANSGSEAMETALRLAAAFHHRRGEDRRRLIVADQPSYHGMTAGALGSSGHPERRRQVGALLPDRTVLVRGAPGALRPGLDDWRRAVRAAGAENIAAIVVEPIAGASGGAAPLPAPVLRALAGLCRDNGVLLIADEVMSGLGRTGRWFGCDHAGVVPDLLALGKGMSAGYTPMAGVLVHDRVLDAFGGDPSTAVFGHTNAGNPLSAAVCAEVLAYLRRHDLPARAAAVGADLERRLRDLVRGNPAVTEVRGQGLLLGLGLAPGPEDGDPLAVARRLVAAAADERLLLYPSGIDAATQSVLVAPPLTISATEIDDLLGRLGRALESLAARPAEAAPALLS
ncbi:aminotransferase class III-fold pyridoxal phosphate-dependent enzyme [Actinomadura roseirufa]|uniref:aminotransferase class III-fold pyridoxal phosphate-dependent enzyme n=1 Tax=Actinomadura roseirufa TaxID=2094049 RepID=UPI0013F14604|nr:aminotransferase class III-fold pyridoxal phosphate-dependent enzyme [Actinomadura roseirufa]